MSILSTYLWAVSLYANWQTAVSLGTLVVLVAVAAAVSYLTRNRSS